MMTHHVEQVLEYDSIEIETFLFEKISYMKQQTCFIMISFEM